MGNRARLISFGFGAALGLAACGSDGAATDTVGSGGASGFGGVGATGGGPAGGTGSAGGGGGGKSAGGGGAGGLAAGNASERAACRAYIEASCRRRDECGMSSGASCLALRDRCPDYFFSPGSTRTVANLLGCVAELGATSCKDVTLSVTPKCATPGTFAEGQPCFFGSQCASVSCGGGNASCSTCQKALSLGAACGSSAGICTGTACSGGVCTDPATLPDVPPAAGVGAECPGGKCVPPSGCISDPAGTPARCVVLPPIGQPCLQDACARGAHCSEATPRTCVVNAGLGQPCSDTVPLLCDDTFVCDPATRVCTARVPAGGVCTRTPAIETCEKGADCITPSGADTGSGVCKVRREEGDPCTGANDRCAGGLSCTSGRCAAAGLLGLAASCK